MMVGNYCVCFIDLLGQREALRGQTLIPVFKAEEDRIKFDESLQSSIGAIIQLQKQAEELLIGILKINPDSKLRAQIPPEKHAVWDEMQQTRIKMQRWSDGLMPFVHLGETDIKCRMNGIFGMFGLAGSLGLIGLASGNPIRGAVEVAWAAELHEDELYGAAVARAYELESEIAQYPRIVVGPEALRLLQTHAQNTGEDVYSQHDRGLARICLSMLVQDDDGHWLLHYLGKEFQDAVSHEHHEELHIKARKFIVEQLTKHKATYNSKLAFRYSHLLQYFDAHEF